MHKLTDLDLANQGTNISAFRVPREDPGFVYFLQSGKYFKIGRTLNPRQRLKPARTWNPELTVIGVKPFWQHKAAEFELHLGMAHAWRKLEWFQMPDESYEWIMEEFRAFDDLNIDANSINFTYMMNGSGMSEFKIEFAKSELSKKHFLRAETEFS